MRRRGRVAFNGTSSSARVERDEAPMLYIGEGGRGEGPRSTSPSIRWRAQPVAKGEPTPLPRSLVRARGLLHHRIPTWRSWSSKTAAGSLARRSLRPEISRITQPHVDDLTVVVLDRPRHAELVAQLRAAGARIKLIEDGDLMAAISVAVAGTGVHAVMGTGGAPEGVLAAAALRCLGAEILGRLKFRSNEERERAKRMGVVDDGRVYRTEDLASGRDVRFVATGVTDGDLLQGVRFSPAAPDALRLDGSPHRKARFIDTTQFEDPANPTSFASSSRSKRLSI